MLSSEVWPGSRDHFKFWQKVHGNVSKTVQDIDMDTMGD